MSSRTKRVSKAVEILVGKNMRALKFLIDVLEKNKILSDRNYPLGYEGMER
jgi:hypothetical protein